MGFVVTVTAIAAVLFSSLSVGFAIWYLQHRKRNVKVIIGVFSTLLIFVLLATLSTYTIVQRLAPRARLDVSPTTINLSSAANFFSETPPEKGNPFPGASNGALCIPALTGGWACQIAL